MALTCRLTGGKHFHIKNPVKFLPFRVLRKQVTERRNFRNSKLFENKHKKWKHTSFTFQAHLKYYHNILN